MTALIEQYLPMFFQLSFIGFLTLYANYIKKPLPYIFLSIVAVLIGLDWANHSTTAGQVTDANLLYIGLGLVGFGGYVFARMVGIWLDKVK